MRVGTFASVPGKLILMGEHAAVYGRPALVAAVGLRVRARFTPGTDGEVELDLRDLGIRERHAWSAIAEYGRRARRAWREYARDPGRAAFARLRGADPAHLATVALAEAAGELAPERPPGVRVRVESEVPIGSGFGSSAATAVALIAGLLACAGRPRDDETIARLALEAERRQHGFPSGVDHRTVLAGGLVFARPARDGGLAVERVAAAPSTLAALRIYDTGRPQQDTGAVVAAVRALRDRDRGAFEARLDRMERLVLRCERLIASPGGDPEARRGLLRDYEACLEELEVVPQPVRRLIRAVESGGGAAKISGAGALAGAAAGCLLVDWPAESDAAPPGLAACRRHRTPMGAEGLRLEPAA